MSDSRKGRPHQVRRQPVRWLLLNVLLLSMVGVLSLSYPVEELSRRAGDFYFRLRENQGTSPDVALVLIDDASLERYGRWPWKRSLLARVVRAASAERPKALGLDILLSEPEDESDDRELAAALEDAGNAVLVGKIGNSPQGRTLKLLWDRTVYAVASRCGNYLSRALAGRLRWKWRALLEERSSKMTGARCESEGDASLRCRRLLTPRLPAASPNRRGCC